MKNNQDIILSLSKSLISRIGEIFPIQVKFNQAELDNIVDRQYRIYKKRYDSRIFFGSEVEHIEPNYLDSLSLNIIKVIANLTDEAKKHGRNTGLLQLQKSLNKCLEKTNVPQWLHTKLCDHLPPLFIKELSTSSFKDSSQSESDKYYIYLKGGKIIESNKRELEKFYNKAKIDKYDIFIEYTDNCRILINNNPNVFRAGKYHAFSILSLFLQRLGKSISYKEIYHIAIKPLEKKRPMDRSKKVYDYLKRINNRIGKVRKPIQTPEKWFSRIHKKGMVQISKKINACLIISSDKLAS